MNRFLLSLGISWCLVMPVLAQGPRETIKKISASFEPASAKPGQTVTLKINIELVDGYHTYPVTQPAQEARLQSNKFTFPSEGEVIYVGKLAEPANAKSKKDDDYELLYYPGGGVWERKAVLSPKAKGGTASTKVKLRLLICDKDTCFPPKMIDVEASLKVLDGSVEVEKAFASEVKKAIEK